MEYDFLNDLANKTINYFKSNEFIYFLNTLKDYTLSLLILFLILLIPVLFMIFKREGINRLYSIVPGYRLYLFFKLLDIPFFLLFIPIVNIIVLYISNYKLAKAYRCNIVIRLLSFIIPFATTLFIAFYPKYRPIRVMDRRYLRTVADVDKIEERLESSKTVIYDDNKKVVNNDDKDFKSNIDNKIEKIESNAIQDNYYDDLVLLESNNEEKAKVNIEKKLDNKEDENIVDNVDVQDLFDNNDIRVNKIESIENKIEESSKKEIIDNSNYKEYKEVNKDVSTIAFGGAKQERKIEKFKTESKEEDLKCPYCSSKLAGSNGTCPGCGKDVSQLVFEKNSLTTIKL